MKNIWNTLEIEGNKSEKNESSKCSKLEKLNNNEEKKKIQNKYTILIHEDLKTILRDPLAIPSANAIATIFIRLYITVYFLPLILWMLRKEQEKNIIWPCSVMKLFNTF